MALASSSDRRLLTFGVFPSNIVLGLQANVCPVNGSGDSTTASSNIHVARVTQIVTVSIFRKGVGKIFKLPCPIILAIMKGETVLQSTSNGQVSIPVVSIA